MAGFLSTAKNRQAVVVAAAMGLVCVLAGATGWYAYQKKIEVPRAASENSPGAPAQVASSNAENTAAAPKPNVGTSATTVEPGAPPTTGAPSSADAGGKPQPPEFDIVRIERTGEGVIAGRGSPGSTILLKDGDKELARALADANGEVVFLPPPLAPGEHALTLQSMLPGGGSGASSQSVKVSVGNTGQQPVAVARAAPEQPASGRADAGLPKPQPGTSPSDANPTKPAPPVSIRSAEAEEGGSFYATGSAPPGSQSRLYLNGAFVGKVIADLNGLWSLKVEKGMQPGHYAVRADEVEPGSGKVIARAEVPFDFPAPAPTGLATSTPGPVIAQTAPQKAPPDQSQTSKVDSSAKEEPKPQSVASSSGVAPSAPGPAAAVVKEVRTTTVAHGDSLWRISKKMLGRGTRYTQIYEANASQIRNPNLVFPGQVFVLPADPG
ncbi:MAG: LysM peptidoglycan-binding domain-containing protein [Hyphomicrobiales bacterium]|nr:LysM peptidoglycan-binding domain-containing protein [Hyphomicrobiales bacterium]